MDSSSPSPSAAQPAASDKGRYTFNPKLRWQPEVEEYFAAAYGRDRFARISEALAHPSRYSCIRVNTLKSSPDAVMHKLMDLVCENGLSDGINGLEIGQQNGGDQSHERSYLVQKCSYAGLENILFVQGSGPHVLHYNSQPDHSVKEIIVSRKCAESVLRGAQVYVPGVLACSAHVENGDKVAVSVAVEQPVKDSGWAVDALYEERKGLYIGQGTAVMSRSGIFRVPHGIAVEMTERVYKLPSFNAPPPAPPPWPAASSSRRLLSPPFLLSLLPPPQLSLLPPSPPHLLARILPSPQIPPPAPASSSAAVEVTNEDVAAPTPLGADVAAAAAVDEAAARVQPPDGHPQQQQPPLRPPLQQPSPLLQATAAGHLGQPQPLTPTVSAAYHAELTTLAAAAGLTDPAGLADLAATTGPRGYAGSLPLDRGMRMYLKGRYFFKIYRVLSLLVSLVMDILKLASEMDLNCIKAYKLDALKSVRKTDEATNIGMADSLCEAIKTLAEDSDTCHAKRKKDGRATIVDEDSSATVVQSDDKNPESKRYVSKAELRKNLRRMKNGPGRNNCSGGRVEKAKGFFPNSFDRVLLDAPCSALGLRPRLFAGEETLQSLKTHARYQRRMFDQAVKLVRPGGVIVYSTCTINPGENEALVRYALDSYKFLSLASQHPKVGGPGIVGSCELFNKTYTEEWLTEDEAELVQRFDPSSPVDTIGFFIAKFSVGEKEN
nr:unnamed protein product [Digitaria exilis]